MNCGQLAILSALRMYTALCTKFIILYQQLHRVRADACDMPSKCERCVSTSWTSSRESIEGS